MDGANKSENSHAPLGSRRQSKSKIQFCKRATAIIRLLGDAEQTVIKTDEENDEHYKANYSRATAHVIIINESGAT